MSKLNGLKPFVGTAYTSKSSGKDVVIESIEGFYVYFRDAGNQRRRVNLDTFYDFYRRAKVQPVTAKVAPKAKPAAPAKPKSEFENE